jgi:transformer-2 protein
MTLSIVRDPHSRESRGFGFVNMVSVEDADRVIDALNGAELNGRAISVEKAKRNKPRTPTPGRYQGPPKRGKWR